MASRAERRRAAAVLFLFAVLHRSTALDHAAADARARKLRAGGAVGHTAGGERASPAQTPSRPAQGNAFDSRTMVFELAVVETETTVPRGGEGVCPALASAVALATRSSCCQAFCAMATRELGAREVVKRAITKSLARTTQTAAKKKKPAKKAAKKPKAKKAKKVPRSSLQRHEL
jgi:hypothetical protein